MSLHDDRVRTIVPYLYRALLILLEHPTCNVTIHQHLGCPKKVTIEMGMPIMDDEATRAQQRLLTTILTASTLSETNARP